MFLRGMSDHGDACAFRAFGEVERGADLGFFGGAAVDAVPERAEAEGCCGYQDVFERGGCVFEPACAAGVAARVGAGGGVRALRWI